LIGLRDHINLSPWNSWFLSCLHIWIIFSDITYDDDLRNCYNNNKNDKSCWYRWNYIHVEWYNPIKLQCEAEQHYNIARPIAIHPSMKAATVARADRIRLRLKCNIRRVLIDQICLLKHSASSCSSPMRYIEQLSIRNIKVNMSAGTRRCLTVSAAATMNAENHPPNYQTSLDLLLLLRFTLNIVLNEVK